MGSWELQLFHLFGRPMHKIGGEHLPPSAGRTIFCSEVDHTDVDKTSISPIIISRRWPEIGVTSKLNPVRRLRRLMIEEIKDHQCYENLWQPRPPLAMSALRGNPEDIKSD